MGNRPMWGELNQLERYVSLTARLETTSKCTVCTRLAPCLEYPTRQNLVDYCQCYYFHDDLSIQYGKYLCSLHCSGSLRSHYYAWNSHFHYYFSILHRSLRDGSRHSRAANYIHDVDFNYYYCCCGYVDRFNDDNCYSGCGSDYYYYYRV
jgi:hypothetical protein